MFLNKLSWPGSRNAGHVVSAMSGFEAELGLLCSREMPRDDALESVLSPDPRPGDGGSISTLRNS
eukprot:2259511-Alexandrium_andersonii.AAC.1